MSSAAEAGGHVQAHRGLFEALPAVLDEAKDKPVIAAGGIGDGRGIYRALSAGASAAMLGTRFVATVESNAHAEYKKALIGAKANDTALTVCFQDGWTATHRVLRNRTFICVGSGGVSVARQEAGGRRCHMYSPQREQSAALRKLAASSRFRRPVAGVRALRGTKRGGRERRSVGQRFGQATLGRMRTRAPQCNRRKALGVVSGPGARHESGAVLSAMTKIY